MTLVDALLHLKIEEKSQQIMTQGEIALNTFEALSAIATSEARWRELKEQGRLQRVFRTITGKNRKIEEAMSKDFMTFQNCAQKSIECLAERQALTIDLLVTMQRGHYFDQMQNNQKFNEINKFLKAFLTDSQQKIDQVLERIESVEVTTEMIVWKETLKYDEFQHQSVDQLSDIEKVCYLSTNFYKVTKGQWHDRDISLLKIIMDHLHLNGNISLQELVSEYVRHEKLLEVYVETVPLYDAHSHSYIEENLLFVLAAYYQKVIEKEDVLAVTPNATWRLRDVVFNFIYGLAALEAASQLATTTNIELIMQYINPDDRIYAHSVLKKRLNMPLDQCRELTKNAPISLGIFEDENEALLIKQELEQLDCRVDIG